jgi:SAM-dependent methyltransferase
MGTSMPKRYDEAYFQRWYRGPDAPKGAAEGRRSVLMAVAVTESILNRDLRTVLDVGAGEGRWQPILQELRPGVSYQGIEPSEYAVARYGGERNLREGSFGELHLHPFDDPFDLVVCADVLHYLSDEEIHAGIGELADLVGGAAFLEIFTDRDPAEGDREGFHLRPPSWYHRVLSSAGLVPIGMQLWVHHEMAEELDAMELPSGGWGSLGLPGSRTPQRLQR